MQKIYFIRRTKTQFGGAENYLSRLVEALKLKDIQCELIYGNLPKWLPTWLKALLFNFNVMKRKKNKFYFSLERITHPDVYRAGDGVHKVYMKLKNSKFNPTNTVYCYLEKRCFNNAKLIIANSNFIKNQIIETYQIPANKIKVIYNGIAIKKPDHELAQKTLKNEFPIIENKKIILFVGSDFYRKGVDIFLAILAQLKSDSFHAFVIGKDKQINTYKKQADSLGLNKQVTFTGLRKDVEHFYALSDIFLFPTRYEPFSNVVLEALATNNVTFTSDSNGASEVLPNDYTINKNNHNIIAEKIDTLLNNNHLLEAEKLKHKQIAQSLSIEKNASETLNAILPIITTTNKN
ncbi:MAG: glycosyltransferase family 1 protein [Gammaproteobacteria bacterium]|nr:MAG: glycosyltransferase family 1 protein [Gammaproteobacteria bacterium]UTW42288.1 glycosyltransferase family 4 protein [bacterium SCSIO 12844]